jgi:hypothetical protein
MQSVVDKHLRSDHPRLVESLGVSVGLGDAKSCEVLADADGCAVPGTVMRAVVELLTGNEARVFYYLWSIADRQTGECCFVRRRVSESAGLPRSSAAAALRRLVDLKMLDHMDPARDGRDRVRIHSRFLFAERESFSSQTSQSLTERLENETTDQRHKGNARDSMHAQDRATAWHAVHPSGWPMGAIVERVQRVGLAQVLAQVGVYGRVQKAVLSLQPEVTGEELEAAVRGVYADARVARPPLCVAQRFNAARGNKGIPGFADRGPMSKTAAAIEAIRARKLKR